MKRLRRLVWSLPGAWPSSPVCLAWPHRLLFCDERRQHLCDMKDGMAQRAMTVKMKADKEDLSSTSPPYLARDRCWL